MFLERDVTKDREDAPDFIHRLLSKNHQKGGLHAMRADFGDGSFIVQEYIKS